MSKFVFKSKQYIFISFCLQLLSFHKVAQSCESGMACRVRLRPGSGLTLIKTSGLFWTDDDTHLPMSFIKAYLVIL